MDMPFISTYNPYMDVRAVTVRVFFEGEGGVQNLEYSGIMNMSLV